jgi:hypothetical protein
MRWCLGFVAMGLSLMTACGGGTLTLSEHSADMATLVETLDSRLDAEAEKYNSGSPTVEGLRSYLAIRVDAYRTAVDGINATDPPDQVEDLHQTFAKIIGNLLTAEEERAAFAHTVDSVEALPLVWDGPESDAVRAAEADAIVLCRAAQTEFDATEQREALADVPWMPSELKEVVSIAFDCP